MTAKLLVVDPVATTREGVALILESCGFQVDRSDSADAYPTHRHTDAVVMNVHTEDDFTGVRALRDRHDSVIVALLRSSEARDYQAALTSGARAACAWDTSPQDLAMVVTAAVAGRTVLPTGIVERLVGLMQEAPPEPTVSAEDLRWLQLLARGGSVTELSTIAGYSPREVFRRLRQLYQRMGVSNRQQAIALAGTWGLVDLTATGERRRLSRV
ncbi:helix-turn-helix domain-containing protein [Micromonospora coxensis]|uniref:Two-component system, NarL family, response regulator YdfI n=1 Tax=Micromonospora coxensis TaxID=356852 RepID=A0A1C5H2K9_9ACTN|nr:LuxR C-terminal-related transcriptional regulator [Micromonospora coxensis]SCG40260.1 two-component system, NarL family, response regulator YdfI [Micromonospora coxensis]